MFGQHPLANFPHPARSRTLAAKAKLTGVLTVGLTAASLWLAAPGLAQIPTRGTRPLDPMPAIRTMREAPSAASLSRTSLFNPKLDTLLATGLLWTLYLSLPIGLLMKLRHNDPDERERLAKLVEHMATLERIWQHSPTR